MPTLIPSHAVIPWEHQQSILESSLFFPEWKDDSWIDLISFYGA